MKHYETRTVTEDKSVLQYTTCDLCYHKIREPGGYDIEEVEISYEKREVTYPIERVLINGRWGLSFPEGGSGEVVEVDRCLDCFRTKLLPWLQSINPEIKPTDIDW